MDIRDERWNREVAGVLNEAALRRKPEDRGDRVTRYVYPPGTCFPVPAHDVDRLDAVLSGCFPQRMRGSHAIPEAGDVLHIPADVIHSAEVVGRDPVVSPDAVRC